MKYDARAMRELHRVQVQSDRALSNIADMLNLETLDMASAAILSERVAEQLKTASDGSGQVAIVTSALALSDLKELCRTLNTHLEEVGSEIRRLKAHGAAANAYRLSRASMLGCR